MNIHPDIMKLKCCIQRSMPWKIQTYLRSGINKAPVWHEPITSSSGDLFETKCRRYRRLLSGAFNSSEQITLYLSQSWYENSSRTQNEIKIYRNWFEFSFWTSGGYADDEWQRQAFLKARIQTDSWRHVCRRARNNERASERTSERGWTWLLAQTWKKEGIILFIILLFHSAWTQTEGASGFLSLFSIWCFEVEKTECCGFTNGTSQSRR